MEIGEAGAFDRIVVASAGKRDDSFFSGVDFDDKSLESWRDHFVTFREKKNCGDVSRARIRDTVQIARDFLRHWAGEEPEVPPTELAKDDLPQRRWIMKDQSRNFAVRRNVKRGCGSETRAENDYRVMAGRFLQFIERRQCCRS